jgi:DeoR/GlpR family transcriptional regulator of sugar metabolism
VAQNTTDNLDAGTTCAEIGRRVLLRSDVTIYTHSIRLAADAAAANSPANVVLIGGEVRNVSQAVVGGLALEWLSHLKFDQAFVAASGVDADGPSTTELSEAAIKSAVLARSKQAVLVADAGKWERSAAVRFGTWEKIPTWVVDANLAKPARDSLKRAGVNVIITKNEETKP